MKALLWVLGSIIVTAIIPINGCNSAVQSDKDIVVIDPVDSIEYYKCQIDSAITQAEIRVSTTEKEVKRVDSAIAKKLNVKPVVQEPKPRKNRSFLYRIFH